MDGHTRFLKVSELRREMHADGCTDERAMEIQAEIRRIEKAGKTPKKREPKKPKEQYMDVLGGYVLDMRNGGRLIGFRDQNGNIVRTR